MESEGWIKLHRKFLEWEWFDSDVMVKLWVYLLLEANHEDRKWRGHIIRRGQIVTSLGNLSEALKVSMRTLRTCLLRLAQTGEIDKQATSQFTIITICNYDRYQVREDSHRQADDKRATSERQTNDKQTTTNKNYKNVRMKEDTISSKELCPTSSSDEEILSNRHCQNVVDFWNRTVVETRSTLPQVRTLSDKRKNKMRIRWKEFAKVGDPVEVCRQIFTKACTSKFCQGDGKSGWSADFDWIFKNGENWVKVFEGNYDNKTAPAGQSKGNSGRIERAVDTFNEVENWIHGRFGDTTGDSTPDYQ